jgi:hypothetical protein
VGTLRAAVAAELGLPEGAIVHAAINDSHAGAIATGARADARIGLMIGTTSVMLDTTEKHGTDLDHDAPIGRGFAGVRFAVKLDLEGAGRFPRVESKRGRAHCFYVYGHPTPLFLECQIPEVTGCAEQGPVLVTDKGAIDQGIFDPGAPVFNIYDPGIRRISVERRAARARIYVVRGTDPHGVALA